MREHHRVCAKIDLDAVKSNYCAIRELIDKETKIISIVKADGYGHGAKAIAQVHSTLGTDYFGVATISEAIELRKSKIKEPILILGHTFEENYGLLLEHHLTQTIYTYEMAKKLSDIASAIKQEIKVHIKIDTGMARLGFLMDTRLKDIIKSIVTLPYLNVEGLFTHFAKADEADKSYTKLQWKRFNELLEGLKDDGITFPIIHASNSAATIDYKEAHFNAIRPGIALYGLYPSQEVNKEKLALTPVLTLVSRIVLLKKVEKDTSVSYGGTFVTKRKTTVAVIPVGYGDGYPRRLSNEGRVLIRGQFAPILGRVCMDRFMVDVTDIKDVVEGDEVVLIGKQHNHEISVDDIAAIVGTINYEIVCQLGKRIPRKYINKSQN